MVFVQKQEFICHKGWSYHTSAGIRTQPPLSWFYVWPQRCLSCFWGTWPMSEKAVSTWWGYNRPPSDIKWLCTLRRMNSYLADQPQDFLKARFPDNHSLTIHFSISKHNDKICNIHPHIHINISCHILPTIGFRKLRLFHLVAYHKEFPTTLNLFYNTMLTNALYYIG